MKPSEAVFFLVVFFFIVMPPVNFTYFLLQSAMGLATFMFTRTYEDLYILK